MQILSNIRYTSWTIKWKRLNMALLRCSVGFSEDSEEIIAVFQMKKNLKLTPKTTKIQFSNFQTIYAFFFQIFDRLCRLGHCKWSTRKKCVVQLVFPNSLLVYCSFRSENVSN